MLQTYVLNSTSLMRLASLLSKSPFAINNRRAFHLGALLMFWYFWAWMSSWLIKLEAETNGWIFSRLCLLLLLKNGIIPLIWTLRRTFLINAKSIWGISLRGHHCWPSYQQQSPKIPPCGKSINTFAHAESLARQRHDLQGPREACDGNILWKYNREHIQQAYLCEILLMILFVLF